MAHPDSVNKHERGLIREELYRLGEALRAAAERPASTHGAAAIRLLVPTEHRSDHSPGTDSPMTCCVGITPER